MLCVSASPTKSQFHLWMVWFSEGSECFPCLFRHLLTTSCCSLDIRLRSTEPTNTLLVTYPKFPRYAWRRMSFRTSRKWWDMYLFPTCFLEGSTFTFLCWNHSGPTCTCFCQLQYISFIHIHILVPYQDAQGTIHPPSSWQSTTRDHSMHQLHKPKQTNTSYWIFCKVWRTHRTWNQQKCYDFRVFQLSTSLCPESTHYSPHYCWWCRNPKQPPGIYKHPIKNGIN